jgi:transposase
MFFNFDLTNFPLVYIDLSGNINNDIDFKLFTEKWLDLYNKKENFYLIFNTKNLLGANIRYVFYMAFFIKKIKLLKKKNLISSKLLLYNNYIYKLATFIFYIEKPIAPIELILMDYNENKINSEIILP